MDTRGNPKSIGPSTLDARSLFLYVRKFGGAQPELRAWPAALGERTRDWLPLRWAVTQNNLGNALDPRAAGERHDAVGRCDCRLSRNRTSP
jgi:hypothetical protein